MGVAVELYWRRETASTYLYVRVLHPNDRGERKPGKASSIWSQIALNLGIEPALLPAT